MEKVKLSTLEEQKFLLKNMLMKTKSLICPSHQCESTLLLQVKRANYVAKLWKACLDLDFTLPNVQNHGWLDSGTIQWVEEVFPEDYRGWLNMDTEEITCGSDTETDSESDDANI